MIMVPCSTLIGAAITKGSSLQRLFLVCKHRDHADTDPWLTIAGLLFLSNPPILLQEPHGLPTSVSTFALRPYPELWSHLAHSQATCQALD